VLGRVFAPMVNPLLTGKREVYRAIPADTVARAMLGASRRGGKGIYRYTYAAINQLSEFRGNQPNPAQNAKKKSG
jgi:hypothetical protein